jgi:hypothetical protein
MLNAALIREIESAVASFEQWLDAYGETSWDHQSYYAGPVGRKAKGLYYRHRLLGTLAVAPMVASEAFLPSARCLFWKKQRLPIADAHYASAFAFLAKKDGREYHYGRAVHFLRVLIETRSPRFARFGWGYPFDWVTADGTLASDTPLITTVPYAYEAFAQVYRLDGDRQWLEIMKSIAEHVAADYQEYPTSSDAASCSYTPPPADQENVVNASAYRACLLTKAAYDLGEPRYKDAACRNLNFVLAAQSADGSWRYATDERRSFIDHFHTCFVMKALAKIEAVTGDTRCAMAIERGVDYYTRDLFDADGLPKPFSQKPRFTVYRRELYDYAECVNLGVLLRGRFAAMDAALNTVVIDLLNRWRKSDGSFRARELLFGWDNVPMHRWAQSQIFRSLSFLLSELAGAS